MLAKRSFSTQNNVKASLGQEKVFVNLDLMQNAFLNKK